MSACKHPYTERGNACVQCYNNLHEVMEHYRRTMYELNIKAATDWTGVSQDYLVGMTGMCIETAERLREERTNEPVVSVETASKGGKPPNQH